MSAGGTLACRAQCAEPLTDVVTSRLIHCTVPRHSNSWFGSYQERAYKIKRQILSQANTVVAHVSMLIRHEKIFRSFVHLAFPRPNRSLFTRTSGLTFHWRGVKQQDSCSSRRPSCRPGSSRLSASRRGNSGRRRRPVRWTLTYCSKPMGRCVLEE